MKSRKVRVLQIHILNKQCENKYLIGLIMLNDIDKELYFWHLRKRFCGEDVTLLKLDRTDTDTDARRDETKAMKARFT